MTRTDNKPPFTLQDNLQPEVYRQQTRRASMIIIGLFAVSAMLLSAFLVSAFGASEGGNFKWNLTGVILGVLLTSALVGGLLRKQPWMKASVYGWQLKRSLMSITNQMHHVKALVAQRDEQAVLLMRFYHLALLHMHQLDGNPFGASDSMQEINEHLDVMLALQLTDEPRQLRPEWLEHVKAAGKQLKDQK